MSDVIASDDRFRSTNGSDAKRAFISNLCEMVMVLSNLSNSDYDSLIVGICRIIDWLKERLY